MKHSCVSWQHAHLLQVGSLTGGSEVKCRREEASFMGMLRMGCAAQDFTCALLWFMQQAESSRIELSRILHAC